MNIHSSLYKSRSRFSGMLVILMLLLPVVLSAQTTFIVTVQRKTAAHPSYGVGGNMGYAIDGVEGKTLTLVRGTTYRFQLQDVEVGYPFYITTSPAGAGGKQYTKGVDGNMVSGNGVLTFTPDSSAPPLLYYQSFSLHYPYMGGMLNIVDSLPPSGVDERGVGAAIAGLSDLYPNPSSGHASVVLSVDRTQSVRVALYSMRGERVATLHDGAITRQAPLTLGFDTSTLPAGVYECVAVGATFLSRRAVVVR
jgi:hypothetical protein